MKKLLLLAATLLLTIPAFSQWKPAGDKIKTQWAETIDVNNVWQEYPRPIMEREKWQNLNGLWNYSVTDKNVSGHGEFQGEILVPFAIQSSLSGVQKSVSANEVLWYEREFTIPSKWNGQHILLHFGAVDWKADVWVNDIKVGSHTGGYTPFYFDITAALNAKGSNKLTVRVYDSTNNGYQPRGKQVFTPKSIWYTAVTGIWQTVWMEPVPERHISDLKITTNIDNGTVIVKPMVENNQGDDIVNVKVLDKGCVIASAKALSGSDVEIVMPADFRLWSPDDPYLYDIEITLENKGKTIDRVSSYTAMRKISTYRGDDCITRMQLNNKNQFMMGPLDQGWWPDGLYTAPCDEAMRYDIEITKKLGFNMIRKHVKVEPARWYRYCDELGIIVWQDMPSGALNEGYGWIDNYYYPNEEPNNRSYESETNYFKEWGEIIDYLYSYPCVCVWVPFNESWGQFKTEEVAQWTKAKDPSRLVNPASGGNHFQCGDILDLHHYPQPQMYMFDSYRATVLGEYGGIGYAVENHLWVPDKNWGYIEFKSSKEVTDKYVEYGEMLLKLIDKGFSAAVYTQTTDCEVEVNGLMTYDRKVIKVDVGRVEKINKKITSSL
ncbi:MAG: beta-galactosidase [Bacteroidales bacterium]|nr:beta-galactosidase [Bacteroidales bacterium]